VLLTGQGKTFNGVLGGVVLPSPPYPAISVAQNIGCTYRMHVYLPGSAFIIMKQIHYYFPPFTPFFPSEDE
jgi:hypothetical protein